MDTVRCQLVGFSRWRAPVASADETRAYEGPCRGEKRDADSDEGDVIEHTRMQCGDERVRIRIMPGTLVCRVSREDVEGRAREYY